MKRKEMLTLIMVQARSSFETSWCKYATDRALTRCMLPFLKCMLLIAMCVWVSAVFCGNLFVQIISVDECSHLN